MLVYIFFFKQKTAYEMRISDWSSDVCSSDLDDAGPNDRPFFGVPITVKESFDIAGLPARWGFANHADHVAKADAVAVQPLKAAGAVILGQTNLPVVLADLYSNHPNHSTTRNPHDHTPVPVCSLVAAYTRTH